MWPRERGRFDEGRAKRKTHNSNNKHSVAFLKLADETRLIAN